MFWDRMLETDPSPLLLMDKGHQWVFLGRTLCLSEAKCFSDKITNWLIFIWRKIYREFLFSDGQFRKHCEKILKKGKRSESHFNINGFQSEIWTCSTKISLKKSLPWLTHIWDKCYYSRWENSFRLPLESYVGQVKSVTEMFLLYEIEIYIINVFTSFCA